MRHLSEPSDKTILLDLPLGRTGIGSGGDFFVMSGGTKCRGNEGVRMPLLSGTGIIFLVNYIRESE